VKLADVNLLLYAYDSASSNHERAREWLEAELSGTETFAFAWSILLAFLRLSTNPRVFESPLEPDEAFAIIDSWLTQPSTTVVHPGDRHLALMRELLEPLGSAGNLAVDAHLAGLAIEHGATLCSADGDFRRFPRLRFENPLLDE
jgi:toxin-antitoxin system PIN domain toxin